MNRKKKAKLVRVLFWVSCAVVTAILVPGFPLLVNSERLREVAPGIERSMEALVQAISGKTLVCVAEPEFSKKTRALECPKNEPVPGTVTSCEVGILADTFGQWSGGLRLGSYGRGGVRWLVDSKFPPTNGINRLEGNASGFGHNLHQWLIACDDSKITAAERKDLDERRREMGTDLRDFGAALVEHEVWAERIKWFIRMVVVVQMALIVWFGISRARRTMRNRAPSPGAPTHEP